MRGIWLQQSHNPRRLQNGNPGLDCVGRHFRITGHICINQLLPSTQGCRLHELDKSRAVSHLREFSHVAFQKGAHVGIKKAFGLQLRITPQSRIAAAPIRQAKTEKSASLLRKNPQRCCGFFRSIYNTPTVKSLQTEHFSQSIFLLLFRIIFTAISGHIFTSMAQ